MLSEGGAASFSSPLYTVPTEVRALSSSQVSKCFVFPHLPYPLLAAPIRPWRDADAGLCLLNLRVFSLLTPSSNLSLFRSTGLSLPLGSEHQWWVAMGLLGGRSLFRLVFFAGFAPCCLLTTQTGLWCEGPGCPWGLSASIRSPEIFNSSRLHPWWGWCVAAPLVKDLLLLLFLSSHPPWLVTQSPLMMAFSWQEKRT